MKKILATVSLGICLLAGCDNEPFGMGITLQPKLIKQVQQQESARLGQADPSLPMASVVFKAGTLLKSAPENGLYSMSCLSVAACD